MGPLSTLPPKPAASQKGGAQPHQSISTLRPRQDEAGVGHVIAQILPRFTFGKGAFGVLAAVAVRVSCRVDPLKADARGRLCSCKTQRSTSKRPAAVTELSGVSRRGGGASAYLVPTA
ncbi:hypothetical protein EYF80_015869 [Liparis tanakae]|uniref:Uncharacterized protein n=1 Tax=Liparis tanakae TaxID=230148 RepID=A0A4Z2I8Y8_9TELE|nr:hypothetical protein EYF80_015869 [Liparis tanakae]